MTILHRNQNRQTADVKSIALMLRTIELYDSQVNSAHETVKGYSVVKNLVLSVKILPNLVFTKVLLQILCMVFLRA